VPTFFPRRCLGKKLPARQITGREAGGKGKMKNKQHINLFCFGIFCQQPTDSSVGNLTEENP